MVEMENIPIELEEALSILAEVYHLESCSCLVNK